MNRVRDSLILDEVIAAAERIEDPNPELLDEYDAALAEERIGYREYLINQAALTLALLVWSER